MSCHPPSSPRAPAPGAESRPLIAHIDSSNPSRTESLATHASNVRSAASRFGARFGCAATAAFAGGIHDFGKAAPEVQDYLWSFTGDCSEEDDAAPLPPGSHRGPDHSTAGAQYAERVLPGFGLLLAYAAAGHHAGMPDGIAPSRASLAPRLAKALPDWETPAHAQLPPELFACDRDAIAREIRPFLANGDGYALAFLARMLFSCLVDADYLETERFMDGEKAACREEAASRDFVSLQSRLESHFRTLAAKAAAGAGISPVNAVREEVRADCMAAAKLPPGLFTLTVPTGGGKTLSSMAFALEHARQHGLDRVIYVIPYTSIIEQNAQVFRGVFGDAAVLEHHGNVDYDAAPYGMHLLSENWDAPIVVTTSVQFFESLHANRPSACRKLHNLARSVVILDEAQSLPIDLLRPCLRALDELVRHYGTTVVLCTATQPAVLAGQLAKGGLSGGPEGCREIIPQERHLHERLRRVVPERIPGRISDAELLDRMDSYPSALVVVNTRRHARELFEAARKRGPERPVFHLSAQMCPQHRAEILDTVKGLLRRGGPCLLVSTQLIEAGVDIDFPCCFRELAGADSLAQAAGRCNREGRLPSPGRVFFFESSENHSPPGFLATAAAKGNEVLALPAFADDLLAPALVTRYFELLYADREQSLDRLSVLSDMLPPTLPAKRGDFLAYKFSTLGNSFRLISDSSVTVFVPYGTEGRRLCEELRGAFAPGDRRRIVRKLARYAVSLHGPEPRGADGRPIAELVHGTWWVLTSPELHYDKDFGISNQAKTDYLGI